MREHFRIDRPFYWARWEVCLLHWSSASVKHGGTKVSPTRAAGYCHSIESRGMVASSEVTPRQTLVQFLCQAYKRGSELGLTTALHLCQGKMQHASCWPQKIQQLWRTSYLKKECALGRVLGPFKKGCLEVPVNRFGVIPKPHQPGKRRLIVDISEPMGENVNEGVNPTLCSLSYKTVDDAVRVILYEGRGTVLDKLDLESVYRVVPVSPEDRSLLGMEMNNQLYVDVALPFGLLSHPPPPPPLKVLMPWLMGWCGLWSIEGLMQ